MRDTVSNHEDITRRGFIRTAGTGLLAAAVPAASGRVPLAPPDKQPPDVKPPGPPPKQAGWAVVGLGKLALEEVMPAFAQCQQSRPVALVSGHRDKALKTAEHYGIDPKAIYDYDNYESLRDNPDVQIVYIILPNSMHAEYTIRAAEAGKHVLCEKPMAVTTAECRQMIDACKQAQRKLMIAYRLRYEPFNQNAIEMARKGEFGKIKLFEAQNNQNVQAPNIRLSKDLGGGPLGDVGVYCLNAARYILGEEPIEVAAMTHRPSDDPRFREVDESLTWQMRFPGGALAHCSAGFGGAQVRRYRATCADGWFELDPAFAYEGLRMRVQNKDGSKQEPQLPQRVNHFAAEMDHFSDCVLNDKNSSTPGEEGRQDMKIVERILEAAASGRTVKV